MEQGQTNKILLAGSLGFCQARLRQIFQKGGWHCWSRPSAMTAAADDGAHLYELMRIENIPIVMYMLGRPQTVSESEQELQSLLGLLHVMTDIQSATADYGGDLRSFYLISYTAADDADYTQETLPQTAAMAEQLASIWAQSHGIRLGVLRLPELYGPGDDIARSLLGRWLTRVLPPEQQQALHIPPADFVVPALAGTVDMAADDAGRLQNYMTDIVYVDDAAYAMAAAVLREFEGRLTIASGSRVSSAALWQQMTRLTGKQVAAYVQPVYSRSAAGTAASVDEPRPRMMLMPALRQASAERTAADELGWRCRYDAATGLAALWDDIQRRGQQAVARQGFIRRQSRWQAWRRRAVPYVENIVGAMLMSGVAFLQGGTPINHQTGLDMNFIYIGTMGLLYGKLQAGLAMLFSLVMLISGWLLQGREIASLAYQPQTSMHVILYIFAAVLTGYFADSRRYERQEARWHAEQAQERFDFLRHLYDENQQVKDRLYHQLVNSDDSIGLLYSIVRRLDSVRIEDVFTQAAAVTSQIMGTRDIALYVMGQDRLYMRQKLHMGPVAATQPRSLRIDDHPYLQTLVQEQHIFVNRELVKNYPDMAAPIVYQGEVIAVVQIFGLQFNQWSLHQQNLLSVTSRLIAASMGRAYQYELAVAAERYIAGTRLLKPDELDAIEQELRSRRAVTGNYPVSVLRVDMTGLDFHTLDERLHHTIRNEDFVGVHGDDVYILLPDADDEVAAAVQQRLAKADVPTEILPEAV